MPFKLCRSDAKIGLLPGFSLAVALSLIVPGQAQNSLQVGYSVLNPAPGSGSPVAIALFRLADESGTLISEAGVEAVPPVSAGRILVNQADAPTGLALANLGSQNANVEFVLRRSDGSVESTRNLTFEPGQHRALFVNDPDLFPQIQSDFFGTMTFGSTAPGPGLAAVTIRQATNGRGEPLFSALPVVPLDSNALGTAGADEALVFPHIGAGKGLSTQIVLFNRTSEAVAGMIRLRQSDGSPLMARFNGGEGSAFPFELAPNGAFVGSLTSSGNVVEGFASVETSTGPSPAGTAIFQLRDPDGRLVSEAGVAASQATRRFRLFIDAVGTQTGVAFANPAEAEAQIDAELRDRSGFLLRSARISVPARGHTACFARELFGTLPTSFSGLMEVHSETPIIPISLKLTENSRGEAILTTLPVADLTHPRDGVLVFPQIGFGSAGPLRFSTQLILLSASLDSVNSGTILFLDESGRPLELSLGGEVGNSIPIQLAPGSARRLRPGNNVRAAQIEIERGALEVPVNVDQTVPVSVVVFDDLGQPRDDFEVSFSSLDPRVAVVDPFGRVTGNEPGFSTLSVQSGGIVANVTLFVVGISSGGDGYQITGATRDLSRRFYLASTVSHTVLRIDDLLDTPTLYAGVSGTAGLRDDKRLDALFNQPAFLALNQSSGILYVSDAQNHAIRQVKPGPDGLVATLAGGIGPGHRDGPLAEARFNQPAGLALDPQGNLWVADSGNHVIRRISLSTGMVETIAGLTGEAGFRGGRGGEARFNTPIGLALESEPLSEQLDRSSTEQAPPPVRVIVADSGNGALRRVDETGLVESLPSAGSLLGPGRAAAVPGLRPFGVAVDSAGNVFVSDPDAGRVRVLLRTGGMADVARPGTFSSPSGIVVADAGRLFVAEGGRFGTEARFGAPEILNISPERIDSRGGGELAIRGRNFAPEAVVVVANRALNNVVRQDTGTLRATLPPLPSGLTTLTVQTRGGLAQTALLVEAPPLSELAVGSITTVVGGSTFSGDGGSALEAPVVPVGIALDGEGRILVLDSSRNSLRRIEPDGGAILSVAGNGVPGSEGDGGPATAASLFPVFPGSSNYLIGVAVDPAGNIFVADNDRIRRVDISTGIIDLVAGGGFGFCGDDEPAAEACFNGINGLGLDQAGNLYIADLGNNRVRRIDAATGLIWTVAGNGSDVFSGDGGPATEAGLDSPVAVAFDASGRLYISTRTRIRRVDLTGVITTLAGNGQDTGADPVDGVPAVESEVFPFGLAIDASGAVFVADQNHHRIRQIDPSGVISTVAGTGEEGFSGDGGPAIAARLSAPAGLALDGSGNVIFCDLSNNRVRRIESTTGLISTVAGNGQPRFDDEGVPLVSSSLLFPEGITFDADGRLYIADTENSRIRQAGLDGRIRTIAGNRLFEFSGDGGPAAEADVNSPHGLDIDGLGNLFFADTGNNRIRRIDLGGTISTVVGASHPAYVAGFGGDGGPASEALLHSPVDVAVDGEGNLFVADTNNGRVRRIDAATGIIDTLVGLDGVHSEPLSFPGATLVSPSGSLLIADSGHHRVLRLDGAALTQAAGGPDDRLCDQSDQAEEVSLAFPGGLAADPDGSFYISDSNNHRVLRVDPDGRVTTVAGNCVPTFAGDGGPGAEASLSTPTALALDHEGNLYIADTGNHRIRAVRIAAPQ